MRMKPGLLLVVGGLAAWSGEVNAGVLTSSAEEEFQQVVARYRQEGLGSPDAKLQGINIEKTTVSVKLQVDGRPLTFRLREPDDLSHSGPLRWFLMEAESGDASTPAAVEARRRLTLWLQEAFVDDPWVVRTSGVPLVKPPTVVGAPMVEQPPKLLPPWVVWILVAATTLLGGRLLWSR